MKLSNKDQNLLEEAYKQICEKAVPCPCTQGKKCTKKECKCKRCHESKLKDLK